MRKRVKHGIVLFVIVILAAQLVRPARANPPTNPDRTLRAAMGTSSDLPAVVARACGDCHSNETEWSWFTRVAPLSWLMARSVADGRRALNFSEWTGYTPEVQRALLAASCADASSGKMPGPYTIFRSATKLSSRDVEVICAAARGR